MIIKKHNVENKKKWKKWFFWFINNMNFSFTFAFQEKHLSSSHILLDCRRLH